MTQDLNQICEIELIYRRKKKAMDRPQVQNSHDAYNLFRENWNDYKISLIEQFKIMLLDRNNRVIGISEVSTGGVHATIVDSKIVFSIALKGRACSLIVAHNHPSGNLEPSQQDINLTKKLSRAGEYLDIAILDHLILTDETFSSLADMNLHPS